MNSAESQRIALLRMLKAVIDLEIANGKSLLDTARLHARMRADFMGVMDATDADFAALQKALEPFLFGLGNAADALHVAIKDMTPAEGVDGHLQAMRKSVEEFGALASAQRHADGSASSSDQYEVLASLEAIHGALQEITILLRKGRGHQ